MPTTNFALPLYTTSDTAQLDTLLNGQSNALDTALLANIWNFAGTDAARIAMTGAKLREGITYRTTDTDLVWYYTGAAWVEGFGPSAAGSVSFTGLYSASGTMPVALTRENKRVFMDGTVISTAATFTAGTSYSLGTIPAGFRPVDTTKWAATSNATAVAEVTITSAGALTMVLNTGFTGALNLSLDGANWRAA